jgi:hypothetical protein
MKKQLWPSLSLIQQRLSPADADISALSLDEPRFQRSRSSVENDDSSAGIGTEKLDTSIAVPAFLQDMFQRREASQHATFSHKPQAGQIVLANLPHTLGVLLLEPLPDDLLKNRQEAGKVWQGLAVAQDSDYAGYWDVLLEEDDGPCDPVAAMIQIWNPVQVYIPETDAVLAQLSPERLQAIRAASEEYVLGPDTNPLDANPGVLGMRSTFHNHCVVTGTPLGGDNDPRQQYQQWLHKAADAIRQPAQAFLVSVVGEEEPSCIEHLFEKIKSAIIRLTDTEFSLPMPQLVPDVAYALGDDKSANKITYGHLELVMREEEHTQLLCRFVGSADDSPCVIRQKTGNLPTNTFTLDSNYPEETLYIHQDKSGLLALCCGDIPEIEVALPLSDE